MSFDHITERRNTHSMKWDKYAGRDILPMWVADMDFQCSPLILDGIKRRTEHGVLGYTRPEDYHPANQAVVDWLATQHQWQIKPEWLVWIPGVVPGFNVACQAFSADDEQILVQTPNYPPLLAAPQINRRERILLPTLEQNGRCTLDFDKLEQAAASPKAGLLILCNPMNPVGSVLSQTELDRVADICHRHNVILCSDEIHCDLILEPGAKHLPAGSHSALRSRSVTLMAASKTFNVAGLGTAFAVIPDVGLRQRFNQAAQGIIPWVTILGLVATEVAFSQCADWHQQLIGYLRANRDYMYQHINTIPGLRMLKNDATFLAWIDACGLGVSNPQSWFEERGIGPSPGVDFGNEQYVRINFGCPRTYLQEMIGRCR